MSVAHVNVIDALMEWVVQRPLTTPEAVHELERHFLPRIRTSEERRIATMFLRAQQLPKKARKLLRIVARLDRE